MDIPKKFSSGSRDTVYSELKTHDPYESDPHSYIEVTEWTNGIGFDVDVCSNVPCRFQMTYSAFELLKKMVEQLDNRFKD